MMKKFILSVMFLLGTILVFFSAGCSSIGSGNNYLRPIDFVHHLNKNGIKVTNYKPLDPSPIGAGDALEIKIGQSNIGVYKYDIYNRDQRRRLEVIDREKRIYFVGIPYPIYEVSGSFIVVGLDKHKEKRRILNALRSFR